MNTPFEGPLSDNSSFVNLPDSYYLVKLFATIDKGYRIEATGNFSVNTSATLPLKFNPSIVYILAILIAIVAVASISLVYFKRRKGSHEEKICCIYCSFAVSMLIGIQAVEVVDANALPFPPVPNTDLPSLAVETSANPLPLNDNNTAAINIIVMQPDAWLSYYMGYFPYVGRCYGYVYLDGVMKTGFPSTHDKVNYYNVSFTGYPSTVLRINDYDHSFTRDTSFT